MTKRGPSKRAPEYRQVAEIVERVRKIIAQRGGRLTIRPYAAGTATEPSTYAHLRAAPVGERAR